MTGTYTGGGSVALRKESVDRNAMSNPLDIEFFQSLSARRAWIEILSLICFGSFGRGRSPQGERG